MIQLLPHQKKAKSEILNILRDKSICYLNGATRSGKTLTVLFAAEYYGSKKVILIRDEYNSSKSITHKVLGLKYGVSGPTIYNIFSRKTWKHV